MSYATTEITSAEIVSDNPVHQRLYFPYEEAAKVISGKVLELGCGWGRGVEKLISASEHYTGLDKNEGLIKALQENTLSITLIQLIFQIYQNLKIILLTL